MKKWGRRNNPLSILVAKSRSWLPHTSSEGADIVLLILTVFSLVSATIGVTLMDTYAVCGMACIICGCIFFLIGIRGAKW